MTSEKSALNLSTPDHILSLKFLNLAKRFPVNLTPPECEYLASSDVCIPRAILVMAACKLLPGDPHVLTSSVPELSLRSCHLRAW